MYEIMHEDAVKGIYDLISKENLGIGLRHNDFPMIQWVNSFLQQYIGSVDEMASRTKWFESSDWMEEMKQ
jgi:polar amino acid transport system substrate-binding protein